METKNRLVTLLMLSAFCCAIFSCSAVRAQEPGGRGAPLEQWAVHSFQPTAQRLVYTAARSLGMLRGIQEQDSLQTIIYEGTGTAYGPGPASKLTPVKLDNYTVEVNYYQQGVRVDTISGGHREVEVAAGKNAWDEKDVPMDGPPVGDSQISMPTAERQRHLQLSLLPFGAIKAAHQNIDKVTVTPLEHGTFLLAFPYAGGAMKITLDRNRRPIKVELGIDDTALGKTTMSAEYSGYKDFQGRGVSDIYFPSHIIQRVDDRTVLDLQVAKCECVNPYVIFPIPESIEKTDASAQTDKHGEQ